MEQLVRNEAMEHMMTNNLLSTSFQHGFVHGRSCTTRLHAVLDKWNEAIEQGDSIEAIYLDFTKGFDMVPHQRLIIKLKGYGTCGKVLHWIAAFLDERRQRVIVNGSKTSWSPVTNGIPQRSVLGPILFVCYTNDMPEVADSPVHMFANDTKIYRQITTQSDQKTLQADLKQLEEWSRKWQLCFNEEKCKVMHLGQNNHKYKYVIASSGTDTTLGVTTNERNLGVQVDPELKFDQHVELIAYKANRMFRLIKRSFTFLDGPTIKKLHSSLIRPVLESGPQHCTTKSNKANSRTEVTGVLRQIEGVEAIKPVLQKSKRRHDRCMASTNTTKCHFRWTTTHCRGDTA